MDDHLAVKNIIKFHPVVNKCEGMLEVIEDESLIY